MATEYDSFGWGVLVRGLKPERSYYGTRIEISKGGTLCMPDSDDGLVVVTKEQARELGQKLIDWSNEP